MKKTIEMLSAPCKTILFIVICCCPILAIANKYANAKPARQTVHTVLKNHNDWKMADDTFDKNGFSVSYIPKRENLSNWTESFRLVIIYYESIPGISAKKFRLIEVQNTKKNCKTATSKIIAQTSQYITYTLDVSGCHGEEPQSQIIKAFNGKDAVYAMHYSYLVHKVGKDAIAFNRNAIINSKLVANPR